jgi:hypothetical protein
MDAVVPTSFWTEVAGKANLNALTDGLEAERAVQSVASAIAQAREDAYDAMLEKALQEQQREAALVGGKLAQSMTSSALKFGLDPSAADHVEGEETDVAKIIESVRSARELARVVKHRMSALKILSCIKTLQQRFRVCQNEHVRWDRTLTAYDVLVMRSVHNDPSILTAGAYIGSVVGGFIPAHYLPILFTPMLSFLSAPQLPPKRAGRHTVSCSGCREILLSPLKCSKAHRVPSMRVSVLQSIPYRTALRIATAQLRRGIAELPRAPQVLKCRLVWVPPRL